MLNNFEPVTILSIIDKNDDSIDKKMIDLTTLVPSDSVRYKRSNIAAVVSLSSSVSIYCLCIGIVILSEFSPIMWLVVFLAMTVSIHGFSCLIHECSHKKLFESDNLNLLVGYFLSIISMQSYHRLSTLDQLHHRQYRSTLDPYRPRPMSEKPKRFYAFAKYIKDEFFCGSINDFPVQKIFGEYLVILLFHSLFIIISGWNIQYLLFIILPNFVTAYMLGRFKLICEHGAVSDYLMHEIHTARTIIAPRFIKWIFFPYSSNFHLEHHLFPSIPHYHLRRLSREISPYLVSQGAMVMTFRETLNSIFDYADSKCGSCNSVCPLKKPLLTASQINKNLISSGEKTTNR